MDLTTLLQAFSPRPRQPIAEALGPMLQQALSAPPIYQQIATHRPPDFQTLTLDEVRNMIPLVLGATGARHPIARATGAYDNVLGPRRRDEFFAEYDWLFGRPRPTSGGN